MSNSYLSTYPPKKETQLSDSQSIGPESPSPSAHEMLEELTKTLLENILAKQKDEQKLFCGDWTENQLEQTLAYSQNRLFNPKSDIGKITREIAYIEAELTDRA